MGDTGTFKTFVVTGSTGINNDGQGNSLNNYAGFLYMIMGQGSAKDSSGNYTNGFSGCVKAGYVDFTYPYNFNYSTGINISIGGTTSLSYQYTNDPSSQKYVDPSSGKTYPNFQPYNMGPSNLGNSWPGSEDDGMNSFPPSTQPIVINADQSTKAYTIVGGSDPQQSSNPINTNYYVSGWSAGSGQTYTVSDQRNNNYTGNTGGIYRGNVIGGTSITYSAGGYYGQIIGDTGAPGPFGYGAGANLNPVVGPTQGYGVITLIPKTSLQYVNFAGNLGGNSGWFADYVNPGTDNVFAWHGLGSTGTGTLQLNSNYLAYMAGGGGSGGYAYYTGGGATNYGGCGGGGGFWGFSIFNSGSYTNYYMNGGNGGTSVNNQNIGPIPGNPGGASSLVLSNLTDNPLTINCLGGDPGGAGDGSSVGGYGGSGYFAGGAGTNYNGSGGLVENSPGYSYLNIPSYSGGQNPSTTRGTTGAGSVYINFFGKSFPCTSNPASWSGGGGGGFWGGYGSAHNNTQDEDGNVDLYLSSAGGYASGGGGGGWGNVSGSNTDNHASGGGSGGFVALYQLIGNTHKFMILNKTQTIPYQNLYQYKGFWAFTENFDTTGNSKNQFINNSFNQIHFLIIKDGVQSIQYNVVGNALTVNFRPLSIDLGQGPTTVPQSFLFTGGKLITFINTYDPPSSGEINTYTQSNYWKILLYK